MKKILFSFALFFEAKPFLEYFQMKKISGISGFQFFEGENAAAVITGSGKISSSIGTALLCQIFPKSEKICNAGIAGSREKNIGKIFSLSKIRDTDTQRDFFPDIYPKKNFPVSSCYCVSVPDENQSYPCLIDMESSGFFQAANNFFGPHQIFLFKMVSDDATKKILNKEKILSLWEKAAPKIISGIEKISLPQKAKIFTDKEEKEIENFLSITTYTHSEKILWKKKIHDAKVRGEDVEIFLK